MDVFKRAFVTFMLIAQFVCVFAQEGEISLEVSKNDSTTVTYDKVMYMLPSEQLGLTVGLNESDSITDVKKAVLTAISVNGSSQDYELQYVLDDGKVDFVKTSFVPEDFSVDYTLNVVLEYSVCITSSTGEDSVATRAPKYAHSVKFHKKEYPYFTSATEIGKLHYAGDSIDIEIVCGGGNQDGWTYGWPLGESSSSNYSYIVEGGEGDDAVDKVLAIKIRNYAPDGKTVWYNDTVRYEMTVYPKPEVEATSAPNLTVVNGDSFTLSVEATGGNKETWEYKWLLNGQPIDGETGNTLACVAIGDIYDRNDVYKVVVTNRLDDKQYDCSIEFTVLVEGVLRWASALSDNLLDGEIINATALLRDADIDAWTFIWKNNGAILAEGNAHEYQLVVSGGSDSGAEQVLSCIARKQDGTEYTITHDYTVWSAPESQKNTKDDIAMLHNQQYTFGISKSGGYPDAWSYQWYLDDSMISGATGMSYNAVASNSTQNVKNSVYKIVAKHTLNGSEKSFTHTFNLESWSAVAETHSAESQDIYYGDVITLIVNTTGGYDGGWSFIWNGNEDSISDNTYTYTASATAKDSNNEVVTLRLVNSHEKSPTGAPLYEKEISFSITSWSHGELTAVRLGNSVADYKSDVQVPITVSTKGGYPNWEYSVYYNGSLLMTTADADFSITSKNNYGETVTKDSIRIVAKNSIPSNGKSKSSEGGVSINVWPVIDVADDFTLSCDNTGDNKYAVRSGNTLVMEVDPATGGNYTEDGNYWKYVWKKGLVVLKESTAEGKNQCTISSIAGNDSKYKSKIDYIYSLVISNIAPNSSSVWFEKSYAAKTVTVYLRPLTPNSLVVKGNGNSNTLICTAPISDKELSARGYEFVFGYTDKAGVEHYMEPTPNRWYQFDSKVSVKSTVYKFWVAAQWKYDEYTAVTSGRVFLGSATKDELFDASYYNGPATRGGTTDIDEIDDVCITFDGRRLIAEANSASECSIVIAAIDGRIVERVQLERNTSFDETIDVSSYPSGIYIVNITIGEKTVSKKIVVL